MARQLVNAMRQPAPGTDEPARKGAHKLFFALWPDDTVRVQVEQRARALEADHHPRGRLLKPARYHLTLQFLGEQADVPPQWIEDVMGAAGQVRSPAFDLSLEHASSFDNVWWLGVAPPARGLETLWRTLGTGLVRAGVQVSSPERFRPHVTVLRDAAARLPPTPILPIQWQVREFVLVDSQPPWPYAILQRWPLPDAE